MQKYYRKRYSQNTKNYSKGIQNLKIRSIKSGTKVFDWTIPPVWNVKDAFILDKYKKKNN